jgi:hypothetical protein
MLLAFKSLQNNNYVTTGIFLCRLLGNFNEKHLIQSKESYIATGFIDPELDQNIIDPKKLKLQADSSELENSLRRGSPAWLGRQTHNLENEWGKRL